MMLTFFSLILKTILNSKWNLQSVCPIFPLFHCILQFEVSCTFLFDFFIFVVYFLLCNVLTLMERKWWERWGMTWKNGITVTIITTWWRWKEPLWMKETAKKYILVTHWFLLWWRVSALSVKWSLVCIGADIFWFKTCLSENTAEVGKNSLFYLGLWGIQLTSWCWAGRSKACHGTMRLKKASNSFVFLQEAG